MNTMNTKFSGKSMQNMLGSRSSDSIVSTMLAKLRLIILVSAMLVIAASAAKRTKNQKSVERKFYHKGEHSAYKWVDPISEAQPTRKWRQPKSKPAKKSKTPKSPMGKRNKMYVNPDDQFMSITAKAAGKDKHRPQHGRRTRKSKADQGHRAEQRRKRNEARRATRLAAVQVEAQDRQRKREEIERKQRDEQKRRRRAQRVCTKCLATRENGHKVAACDGRFVTPAQLKCAQKQEQKRRSDLWNQKEAERKQADLNKFNGGILQNASWERLHELAKTMRPTPASLEPALRRTPSSGETVITIPSVVREILADEGSDDEEQLSGGESLSTEDRISLGSDSNDVSPIEDAAEQILEDTAEFQYGDEVTIIDGNMKDCEGKLEMPTHWSYSHKKREFEKTIQRFADFTQKQPMWLRRNRGAEITIRGAAVEDWHPTKWQVRVTKNGQTSFLTKSIPSSYMKKKTPTSSRRRLANQDLLDRFARESLRILQ